MINISIVKIVTKIMHRIKLKKFSIAHPYCEPDQLIHRKDPVQNHNSNICDRFLSQMSFLKLNVSVPIHYDCMKQNMASTFFKISLQAWIDMRV